MSGYVLAIDQGTTSTRAIVFDGQMQIAGAGQKEFRQIYPRSGWVEHDPEEIWDSVVSTIKMAIREARIQAKDIAALGITNQRETVVVWERESGKPIHNAIVWQDRRTASYCDKLKRQDLEKTFTKKTGLLLDPYFSGTKLSWLLANVKGARARAAKGELCFGTVDAFLIWRLTGGKVFATDATNASRTLMYNISDNCWDKALLDILRVPAAMLPEVKDCADDFGITEKAILGAEIPIFGVAGDQHAATIGQACFEPGMMKSTYGTGCFALLNTGSDIVGSKNRLLTTIAYRLNGETTYALEGSIFIAGAAVQWLRDGLGIIDTASRTGELADAADPTQEVYLVPAFTGLGAPHWDANARGAIFGLTRNSGPKEFARAALEAVCYQSRDLLDAMHKDWKGGVESTVLRVDGGMVASDWTMQRLADILDAPVDRPVILETTALGAAWLAGSRAGVWPDRESFAKSWKRNHRFEPAMDEKTRAAKLKGWRSAVKRTLADA
ncbi:MULTISPECIES: glycerol kinase GlpK [Rhizobium]|uniref:Glycerol kinase n=1 Tax=Rhizobium favelukesii TaxID=348824 RepID=W6RCT9_9HYPH|nr:MULTISPECIES: glycerol kinase GlpK [Rhizobium]MCA0802705.1 glycerol kinase GlpK [Rhizobium sp. T1473]MCS0457484.1 glycerol kinase GlpK [Rhizobium favelukesii]UFS83711.1 glycerol kinase GlpK [Rhizobium sp. T136]CDM58674.1 glycerol kinase [Rhizobium favelukesii]